MLNDKKKAVIGDLLYRAADMPLILAAIVRHINGVGVDLIQAA